MAARTRIAPAPEVHWSKFRPTNGGVDARRATGTQMKNAHHEQGHGSTHDDGHGNDNVRDASYASGTRHNNLVI